MVHTMTKLSPRDAVKLYQVSRATLMRALSDGKISAEKTDAGHWLIDGSELARVYTLRASQKTVSRAEPEHMSQRETPSETGLSHDLELRLARAEAELAAERAKVELLERHLDDVRRMLPPPDPKPRRGWWPW
jgi:hypothetical protein